MKPFKIFSKLVLSFDLATSFFRSFELSAITETMEGLKANGRILDIGCAEGVIGREVLADKKDVYGLDYDRKFLMSARTQGIYKNVLAADATHMPFTDRSFGLLFSNSVLEHIPDAESVLKEAARIMQSEGLFLFTVPNGDFSKNLFYYRVLRSLGLNSLALKYTRERNKRLNHFHLHSHEQWSLMLKNSGLKDVFMRDYISGPVLMAWDLIASVQFLSRKIFFVFFKMPVIKTVFLLLAFVAKLFFSVFLLPFLMFSMNTKIKGCATLILAKKS